MSAEERRLAELIRDCIYGLRNQPEHSREVIATILERDVLPLAAGVSVPAEPGAPDRLALLNEKHPAYLDAVEAALSRPVSAPEPSARLREAAQNVVDRAHVNQERKDKGLDALPTRVSELEAALAAAPQDTKENR